MTERKRFARGVLAYLSIMISGVIVLTLLMNFAITIVSEFTVNRLGAEQVKFIGNASVVIKNFLQNTALIFGGVLFTVSGKSEGKKPGFSYVRAILFSAVAGLVFTAFYCINYFYIHIDYRNVFLDAIVTMIVYSILPAGFILALHLSFKQKLHCCFSKDRIIGTIVFVLVIIGLYWGSAYFLRTDYLAGNISVEKYILIITLVVLIMRILLLLTVSFLYYPQVRCDSRGGEVLASQDDILSCDDTNE